jgi:uncharacterized membrane protein (DUF106 family)
MFDREMQKWIKFYNFCEITFKYLLKTLLRRGKDVEIVI